MNEKPFCRCCLSTKCYKNVSDEYVIGDRKEVYGDMLLNTFNINVLNSSYNFSLICETCIVKLRNATEFREQVLKAQETIFKEWDGTLKNSINLKIELDDTVDCGEKGSENFLDADFVCDDETPRPPVQLFTIKLEPHSDEAPNESDAINKTAVNVLENAPVVSNIKQRVLRSKLTKTGEKTLKSVIKVKNVKKVNAAKKLTNAIKTSVTSTKDRRYEGPPTTQSEIDARENTLKLIQNSNLCLFRSLKTKFGCFMCKASFVEAVKLREHSITHKNTTLLAHRVCKWRGLSYKNADISNLKCNKCSQNVPNLNDLIKHLNDKHNIPSRGNSHFLIPYRLVDENQCALCELKFKTFLRLSMHMNSHYTNNVCENCGMSFINRLSLRMHVLSQHREKICSFCPAKFMTSSSITKHLKKDHNIFNLKRYCNLCDKTFPNAHMLNKHKIEEHSAKKIVVNCNECGKAFHHEANLRIHIRSVHIKERNYPCEICGKSFFTKCDQKRHEITHDDVRSFSCNYCDSKFKSKDSCRRHTKQQHRDVST